MTFKTEKQRRGFFAGLAAIREQHRQKVEMKLNRKLAEERKELDSVTRQLEIQKQKEELSLSKQRQVQSQKSQVESLKQQIKDAKRERFKLTKTGRALSFVRKEAGIGAEKAKKFSSSPDTKKALKKIRRELGL